MYRGGWVAAEELGFCVDCLFRPCQDCIVGGNKGGRRLVDCVPRVRGAQSEPCEGFEVDIDKRPAAVQIPILPLSTGPIEMLSVRPPLPRLLSAASASAKLLPKTIICHYAAASFPKRPQRRGQKEGM